jgi:mRNA deadenylase 3'-5' endonuclease subunit Ccr4
MSFRVATYNVLATAYLAKGDYSRVPKELLDPVRRVPALVRHVTGLKADLICLQEVEVDVFEALEGALEPQGYTGHLELKGRAKPDGCATFYSSRVFTLSKAMRLEYQDREKGPAEHSGFVALLLALKCKKMILGVANTHLRWDRPGTPLGRQIGRRQVLELLERCQDFDPPCDGWLLCGDLNSRPDSPVVATIQKAGFEYAHIGRPQVRSAVINGRASLLDYLFHTSGLLARPVDPPKVVAAKGLPSREHPSDHLPFLAEFAWAKGRSSTAS